MSNLINLSPRVMMGAAIVGIVGAAGVFIYEQIYAEKRRTMLVREVARLDRQVASMRTELETIRELQKETNLRRMKQRKSERAKREKRSKKPAAGDAPDVLDAPEKDQSYASDSEYYTDYQSVIGTDGELDSEEYYDVNTDEEDDDDTLRDSVKNGHASNALDDDSSEKLELPKSPKKSST